VARSDPESGIGAAAVALGVRAIATQSAAQNRNPSHIDREQIAGLHKNFTELAAFPPRSPDTLRSRPTTGTANAGGWVVNIARTEVGLTQQRMTSMFSRGDSMPCRRGARRGGHCDRGKR
jgi:hypothetical protein